MGTSHLSATQRMGYSWSESIAYQDVRELYNKRPFNLIATSANAGNAPIINGGGLVTLGTVLPLVVPGSSLLSRVRSQASSVGNFEALKTATINSARNAHVDGDLVSIEPGKIADLVVFNGDPVADINVVNGAAAF